MDGANEPAKTNNAGADSMILGWGYLDVSKQTFRSGNRQEIPQDIKHRIRDDRRAVSTIADDYGVAKQTVYAIKKGNDTLRGKIRALSYTKLKEADIMSIYRDGRFHKEIAKQYNISPTTVGRIKNGERFAEITGHFRKELIA